MAGYIGGTKIQNLYVGDTQISKAYIGEDLVYSQGVGEGYVLSHNSDLSFAMPAPATVPRTGIMANFRANKWGRGITTFARGSGSSAYHRVFLYTPLETSGNTGITNYQLSGSPPEFGGRAVTFGGSEPRIVTTAMDKPDSLLTVASYRANQYIDSDGTLQRWFLRMEGNVGTDNQGSNFNGATSHIFSNPDNDRRATTDPTREGTHDITFSADATVDYYIRTWVPFGQNFIGVTLRPRQVGTHWTQAQQIRFDLMDFSNTDPATLGIRSGTNTRVTDDDYSTASGLTLQSLPEDWNKPEELATFVPGTTTPEELPPVRKFQAVFHETTSPDGNSAAVEGKLFIFGTTGIPADGLDTETNIFGVAVPAEDASRPQVQVIDRIYVYDVASTDRGLTFSKFSRDTEITLPRHLTIPGVAIGDMGVSDMTLTEDGRYLFITDHLRQRVECFDFYIPPTG